MMNIRKMGFSTILGIVLIGVAVVGLATAVLVVQSRTGFSNFASSTKGNMLTMVGRFPEVLSSCVWGWWSAQAKCVKIRDEGDGKTYEVILLPNMKVNQFLGKRVQVMGRLDGDNALKGLRVWAVKIEVLGDGGQGGGQGLEELKLKVVPSLASEMGKINLSVSWNDQWLANSHLKDFRLDVRPVGGKWMLNSDSVGKVAGKEIANLPVKNGDYQVRLMAFFDNAPMKYQDVEIGVFEEGFEVVDKKSLTDVWGWHETKTGKVEGKNGEIWVSEKGAHSEDFVGPYAWVVIDSAVYLGSSFAKREPTIFEVAVELKSLQNISGTEEASGGLYLTYDRSGAGVNFGLNLYDDGKAVLTKKGVRLTEISGLTLPAVFNAQSGPGGKVNWKVNQKLVGQTAADKLSGIGFYLDTRKPTFPEARAVFDNFRFVWVEGRR